MLPGVAWEPYFSPTLAKLAQVGVYTDEWGSVWEVGEPGIIGEVKQPALTDWAVLDSFKAPYHTIRERDLGHINRCCDTSDKFILSSYSDATSSQM